MTTQSNLASLPKREISPGYVRALADALALRDWTLALSDQVAETGYNAQIAPLRGRKRAVIRLGSHFSLMSSSEQRHALVHELLHLHLAPCTHVAQDVFSQKFLPVFLLNLEFGIDGIADAIAPLLPLP